MGIFWIFYACWLYDFFPQPFRVELCCAPSTRPVVSVWQSCGARAVDAFPNGGAFRGLVLSLFLEEAPAGRECFASSGKQFLHVSFRRNLSVQVVL